MALRGLVAFDGGGVRGLVSAAIVRELEQLLAAPLGARVDELARKR